MTPNKGEKQEQKIGILVLVTPFDWEIDSWNRRALCPTVEINMNLLRPISETVESYERATKSCGWELKAGKDIYINKVGCWGDYLEHKMYIQFFLQICNCLQVIHVDNVRICLWTAALNGPIIYPPEGTESHDWNIIDRKKPENSLKNLSQCHFVKNKYHINWPRR